MPRKTRKQLVGKTEDYEQRGRERSLRRLARELRLSWQVQAEARMREAA